MSVNPKIAIVILAAGEASRMGKPKQLLPWKNSTLLGHTIENAQNTNATEIVLVLGANYDRIHPHILSKSISVIYNNTWNQGLGNSIAVGIEPLIKSHINYDGALLILADQPLIDTLYLNAMIDTFKDKRHQIIASNYSADTSTKKLGVPVLFDKIYFNALSQLDGDQGAKKVITEHMKNVTSFNANHLLADIDTIEDYERLYDENH